MPIFFKKIKGLSEEKPYELVLIGIILFVFIIGLLFLILLLPSLADIQEKEVSIRLGIAQNAKSEIEGFLNENVKALNLLAQILVVSAEKKSKLDIFLKEKERFEQISVIDSKGQEVLKSSRFLTFFPEEYGNVSWSEAFIRPMKEGKIFLSLVYFSEKSVPFITIGIPMKASPNQITGVLVAELSLQEIWDVVSKNKLSPTVKVYLVDSQGYLVSHPDFSLVLKKLNLLKRRAVEKVILEKKTVYGLDKDEEYFNEKGERVNVVGLFLEEIGWGVFIEEPIKDSQVSYRKIRNLGLIAIVVSVLLSLMILFSIRTLIRALRVLKESRVALEESKTTLEVKVQARTRELRGLTENLDEQVRQRTKELQEKIDELEKFQRLAVGRELKMIELKEEIKKLKEELEKLKVGKK